ncbi:hypothetical protein ASD11_02750 [Aeromicrobium sp. Root495]|uniref:hypothetical protein n=1 Tax=Aeromicrobium sp. Root495 TaxID=1736550 RepID=UPI0006F1F122|nr:hypothetical protein [Aeromicrobium sp. Root495]KQY58592.1 hypothetical protein ASD11_02750 [Aeromicrobium sp. Root495]
MPFSTDARSTGRRVLLVLLAALTLTAGLLAPAQALADTGKISGTVKNVKGEALPLVPVNLYQLQDGFWDQVGYRESADGEGTAARGTYSFTGLAAGTYRLGVERTSTYDPETGTETEYASDFWPGNKPFVQAGTDVVVSSTAQARTANFFMIEGGQIRGHVTNVTEEQGNELNIRAHRLNAATGEYERVRNTSAGEEGAYALTGLLPGKYRIELHDGSGTFLTEFYDDQPTVATAEDVVVPEPGDVVTGKDASLARSGRIAGRVTNAAKVGVADVYISISSFDDATKEWVDVSSGGTEADGTYSIGGLKTGTKYRVAFFGSGIGYLDQYYDGKDEQHADLVSVVAGQTTPGIDAVLLKLGKVTGKVTLPDGKPAVGTVVTAYEPDGDGGWDYVADDDTSSTGLYSLADVRPGAYKLQFKPSGLAYAPEVYTNKTSLAAGNAVVVKSGTTTTGINAQLAKAGAISGTVTLPSGVTDVRARSVAAVDKASGEVLSYGQANKTSAGTYAYSIKGLGAGSYRVDFARGSGQSLATGQYYRGVSEKQGPSTATPVKVSAGTTTSKINATVRTGGGSIRGTVLNQAGAPIKCYMMALTDDGSRSTRVAYSSATTGAFTIKGLSTGRYKLIAVSGYGADDGCFVGVGDDRYSNYYYDTDPASVGHMSARESAADTVSVTEGAATTLPHDLYYGPVTGSTFTAVPSPVVTGTGKVGSTLSSTGAAPTPRADSVVRQWYRGSTPITHQTGPTYKLVAADAGTPVSVRYTYKKSGYVDRGAGSSGIKVAGVNLTRPTITGTAAVGKKLTATKGTWGGSGWTYSYRWYRGTTRISTRSAYTTTSSDRGKTLTVKVSISKSGYTGASATSAGRKIS